MGVDVGHLPHLPGEIVIDDGARRDGEIKQAAKQLLLNQGQVAGVARPQPPLPVRHFFAGLAFIVPLAFGEQAKEELLAVDRMPRRARHCRRPGVLLRGLDETKPAHFGQGGRRRRLGGFAVAARLVHRLQKRHLGEHFGQTFRMQVQHADALAAHLAQRLRLRPLHGVEQRVEQIQRNHHQHARLGVDALQLPGETFGVNRQLLRARPGEHAVGFDVFFEPDTVDGVGVRVDLFDVRALADVRVEKHRLGADFASGAQRFDEGVAGFDGQIDGAVLAFVVVEDDGQLRQALDGAAVSFFESDRQLDGYDLGFFAQDLAAKLGGELQAARSGREIADASAAQTSCVTLFEHSAAPRGRGFGGWRC